MRNFCDPGWLSPRVFQLILVSAVIMAIFWGTGSVNAPDQYLVTASVLYVFLMFSMFGAASYTPALVVERPLFIKWVGQADKLATLP